MHFSSKIGSRILLYFQALWDINRWGNMGTRHFRYNVHYLLHHLQWCLRKSPHCQVIWMTTPPIRCVFDLREFTMFMTLDYSKTLVPAVFGSWKNLCSSKIIVHLIDDTNLPLRWFQNQCRLRLLLFSKCAVHCSVSWGSFLIVNVPN